MDDASNASTEGISIETMLRLTDFWILAAKGPYKPNITSGAAAAQHSRIY